MTGLFSALCGEDFAIEEHFAGDIIRAGVSEPFTALCQVPELLRSADVVIALECSRLETGE